MKKFRNALNVKIRRGYALLFAFVFIFIIGMSALPAVLMADGYFTAGRLLYRGFHLLCHQYPWRSWFLRGEQPFYPLISENKGVKSFEEASGFTITEISPRTFYGSHVMGYKMAICQRDTAIYGTMALFGVLFFLSGNKIRGINWKMWLVFGILPIGLDGGSQLLSQVIPSIPFRESTPLLRSITGALFGFLTCWYLLPKLEETLCKEDPL